MNKEGTGKLIKDARVEKGFTQTELGDLVGVSNKAVSRWETGESFPDVALLDGIANVLDLQIEELVRGEKEESKKEGDADLWNEIVLELKLQRRSQRKQLFGMAVCGMVFLFIAGLSFLIFSGGDVRADIFCMVGMAAVMIFTIVMQRNITGTVQGKWIRAGKILSIAGGVYAVFILLAVFIPMGLGNRIGMFLHYQLCAVWLIQMGWLMVCSIMVLKQKEQMTIWILVAEDIILFVLLYDHLLHCLTDSAEEMKQLLLGKLLMAGVMLAVALIVNDIVRKSWSKSRQKTAA